MRYHVGVKAFYFVTTWLFPDSKSKNVKGIFLIFDISMFFPHFDNIY